MKKYDKVMMATAELWAKQSKCKRRQVGAVIAKDGRILSIGYNGTPSGYKEYYDGVCDCCRGSGVAWSNDCPCCAGKGFVIVEKELDCEDEIEVFLSKCCNTPIVEDLENKIVICSKCGKEIGVIDVIDGTDTYRTIGEFAVKKELKTNHKKVIHAEANAILFCAKNGLVTKDTTLYVTMSPCAECSKMIIQAGIKRVVYKEEYRDTYGLELMKKCGIKVEQLKD